MQAQTADEKLKPKAGSKERGQKTNLL